MFAKYWRAPLDRNDTNDGSLKWPTMHHVKLGTEELRTLRAKASGSEPTSENRGSDIGAQDPRRINCESFKSCEDQTDDEIHVEAK